MFNGSGGMERTIGVMAYHRPGSIPGVARPYRLMDKPATS